MLTVSNRLATNLLIPEGLAEKGALTLPPNGEAKVEKVTANLKDAEKRGLLAIAYPPARKSGKAKTAAKSEPKTESKHEPDSNSLSTTGETD